MTSSILFYNFISKESICFSTKNKGSIVDIVLDILELSFEYSVKKTHVNSKKGG